MGYHDFMEMWVRWLERPEGGPLLVLAGLVLAQAVLGAMSHRRARLGLAPDPSFR